MFIGEKKISSLRAFLEGAFYTMYIYGITEAEETGSDLGNFHDWVARYYGWSETTVGWNNIILQECNGNEEKALDQFFILYDEFKNESRL